VVYGLFSPQDSVSLSLSLTSLRKLNVCMNENHLLITMA
jgi:hypothetical protein